MVPRKILALELVPLPLVHSKVSAGIVFWSLAKLPGNQEAALWLLSATATKVLEPGDAGNGLLR